jgi:hypothetical protein
MPAPLEAARAAAIALRARGAAGMVDEGRIRERGHRAISAWFAGVPAERLTDVRSRADLREILEVLGTGSTARSVPAGQ